MKNNSKKILLLPIFLAVFGLGFFAFSAQARAATYYVATNGSDSNNGSLSSPWATFNYAISQAISGDTIIAKAGTYNQTITVTKPSITIQGELDYSGNRLSIIDPYMNASGEWTDTGNGVWSKNFAYPVYAMAVEVSSTKYKIPRLCQPDDTAPISSGPSDAHCAGTALEGPSGSWDYWLRSDDESTQSFWSSQLQRNVSINVFDAFETFFSCLNNSPFTCYVRFRDKATDMNTKTLYVAQNSQASITVSASNVTIKDFDIKAIAKGISIGGIWGSEVAADSVTVDNCEITLGKVKVWVTSGGTNATVKNNVLHDFDYAREYVANPEYVRGAYLLEGTYPQKVKYLLRHFEKYKLSPNGDSYVNTGVIAWGDNTSVQNNRIYNLHTGVDSSSPGTNITNNFIYRLSSVGAVFGRNNGTIYISNNTMHDVGSSGIRFMEWGGGPEVVNYRGVNHTTAYIYNNKIWFPSDEDGLGEGMKFHFTSCTQEENCGTVTPGTAWIYHNSFSGGNKILGASTIYSSPLTGMQEVHYINNIFSGGFIILQQPPGECVYNWYSGLYYGGHCSGVGNKNNGSTMLWNTSGPHNFDIPSAYRAGTAKPAEDSACDMTDSVAPYSCGSNLSAFPGVSSFTMFGGGFDMGAVEMGSNADVNSDNHINIKDIQACIKVITGADTRYQDQCKVLAAPTDRTNIKDIQVIIQKILNP